MTTDDAALVGLARSGDQGAFATLYERYFERIYDFVARMMRDRDEAADVTQDTFVRAMNGLGSLQEGANFKAWLFTIARNQALTRIERAARTRPLVAVTEDGDEARDNFPDPDRLGDPAAAAESHELAALVWEAAKGLDARQYSVLDLHIRQGLESAEIAGVLGVTKNNASVMVNRLKQAMEEAVGALVLLRGGRGRCAELDALVAQVGAPDLSPELRRAIERHSAACEACEERKKNALPFAAFAALPLIAPPAGAKAHILEAVLRQWPGAVSGGGGATVTPFPGAHHAAVPPAEGNGGKPGFVAGGEPATGATRRRLLTASAAVAATVAGLVLFLSLSGADDSALVPTETQEPGAGPTLATPPAPPATATSTPTVAPSPTATSTVTSTATQGARSPTAAATSPAAGGTAPGGIAPGGPSPSATTETPAAELPTAEATDTPTAEPTPTAATPTATPPEETATTTPTTTATASATATLTPTPPTTTPSPSATAPLAAGCVRELVPSASAVTLSETHPAATVALQDRSSSECRGSTTFSAVTGAKWLRITPTSGSVLLGERGFVIISLDRASLPQVSSTARVVITSSGGQSVIMVHYTAPVTSAPAP